MKSQLTDQQVGNLTLKVIADLRSGLKLDLNEVRQERSITKYLILPIVRETLNKIGEARLFLGSDGEKVPKPLIRFGMTFSSDLEIRYFEQRCLAIEVKILRNNDPSGSLSKAIGQSLIYRNMGFLHSICLVIDSRNKRYPEIQSFLDDTLANEKNTHGLYFG